MKRLVSVHGWRCLVLVLGLLVKEHALQSTAAGEAEPGVCRETREVEMIHNVTVYQPCIRRLAVPCGRPGSPPRPCTLYAQRTCTYTTSRLQLQNVTGDVCCHGFTEGPHGNCLPDDYVRASEDKRNTTNLGQLPSDRDRNQTSSPNITQDHPIELPQTPLQNSSSITPPSNSTTAIPLLEVLSRPSANSTEELEGGGTLRNGTTPSLVPHPPYNVTTIEQPLLTPHNVTVPMVQPATWSQRSTKEPLFSQTTPVHPETSMLNASTVAPPPHLKEVTDHGNASGGVSSTTTVGLMRPDLSDDRTTTKSAQSFSRHTNTPSIITPTTTFPRTKSTSTLSTTPTSASVFPSTTEKLPSFADTQDPKEVNSTYNVIQLPMVPKAEGGGSVEDSSPAPNGSVVVLQAGTGMIPLLPSAVYVAVTIAAVVIIVTLVCAVYVFILRDKPRTTSTVMATCPQRGVEAGDFLLTESIYATCNGYQPNTVRANGRAALPMPDSSTAEAFRRGIPAILPHEATNGRLRMVPEEPPLTTSTPMMGDKLHGFGYTNPAYNSGESINNRGAGDTASLSDASDLHETSVVRDTCGDDGYLVPISHRPTPPSTPLAAMRGNGVGGSPSSKIKSSDREEQASSPLSLSRTGSNSTHTYEEIPAHIGVSPPPILPNTTKSLDYTPGSKDPCDVGDDISIGDDAITNDEATGDDASVDLVTFMTNYLSNSCLAANNNSDATCGSRESYSTPTSDPNATYDRADMYTPATPAVKNSTLTPPGVSEVKLNGNRNSPTLETLVEAPSAPYAAAAKVRVKDGVSGVKRWDSRRSCSYENIYDTVGPPDSDARGSQEEEEEGEEEKPGVVVTPALPARRRMFQYSPTLPVKFDMDYDVIDLSDNDEDDGKQWTKVESTNNNENKAEVNGEGCKPSVLPPSENEPHYLSLVGDDDWDKAPSSGDYQDLRDIGLVIGGKETEA